MWPKTRCEHGNGNFWNIKAVYYDHNFNLRKLTKGQDEVEWKDMPKVPDH